MNDEDEELQAEAQEAWIMYRDMGPLRHLPRRQLRRREFIAGYIRGVKAERGRDT